MGKAQFSRFMSEVRPNGAPLSAHYGGESPLRNPGQPYFKPFALNVSDGVDTPRRHRCAMMAGVEAPLQRGASMGEVSIIGLDLAKNVFQAHGCRATNKVRLRVNLDETRWWGCDGRRA